jgi:putative membrane protein
VDPYSWHADWGTLLVLAALAGVHFLAHRRWRADKLRVFAFELGLILLLVVYITPLHTIALNYLLSVHLLQNVVTAEWAPGLVVLGVAPALAREIDRFRVVRIATHPFVALPLWLGTYYVWHVPAIYDTALDHPGSLLHVEHATYFAAGMLMWWPVIHGRLSDGAKALYLFGAFVLASPLGLLLALLPTPVYDFYERAPQLWGLSDLTDQQIAGVTMAVEQAIFFFAVFVYFFLRFLRTEHIAGAFNEGSR